MLNRTCPPSDVIAFVVLWRLRHRLTPRDLIEITTLSGSEISHAAIREARTKLLPVSDNETGKCWKGWRREP